jgi:phosphoribosylaminoimidazole-succinocarboxamide synthase
MDLVNLSVTKTEPAIVGSVQRMYSIWDRDAEYLLCEATDDGSVFDVGRFFVIQGSGQARNTLRHQVFSAMRNAKTWQGLSVESGKFSDKSALADLFESEVMDTLRARGVPSHHIGAVNPSDGQVDGSTSARPSNLVVVERVPVVKPVRTHLHNDPVYDYTMYRDARDKVVALEQIVRLGLPGGSAVLNQLKDLVRDNSSEAAEAHAARYGVATSIKSWSPLPRPICDWQCKYEDQDRNLSPQEALYISGLSAAELTSLGQILTACSLMVDAILSTGGLRLWDLKWEAAVKGGSFCVVDTMDHDSMRVTQSIRYGDVDCYIHFNKQSIRDYFKIFHAEWVAAINHAKRASKLSVSNRPFMEIYREGVSSGRYPSIPALDPSYADLQSAKYQYVTSVACGTADVSTGYALAREELAYYQKRGRLDGALQYLSRT